MMTIFEFLKDFKVKPNYYCGIHTKEWRNVK
jgi:hypothetical protein